MKLRMLIEEKLQEADRQGMPVTTTGKLLRAWLLRHGKLTSLGRKYLKYGIPFTSVELRDYLADKALYKRAERLELAARIIFIGVVILLFILALGFGV